MPIRSSPKERNNIIRERTRMEKMSRPLGPFGIRASIGRVPFIRLSRYLTAPTVKPAMKRSRNRLYMNAMGRLAIRQAAISAPQ